MVRDMWLITNDEGDAVVAATTFEKVVAAMVDRKHITAKTYVWIDGHGLSRVDLIFGNEWKERVLALTLNEFLEMFEGIFSVQFVPFYD